ncbi:MAG: D-alanine--D-alanine ligase [Candidatus Binatia bacterium]
MPGFRQGLYRDRRVGVLLGGFSAEREISRVTGREVIRALKERGYRVIPIEVKRDLPLRLRQHRVEVVFNALHGKMGEDGCVQGLLEVIGIPYTGSGVTASALSMDKVLAKDLFRRRGIPTPPYQVLHRGHGPAEVRLSLPLVVKPRAEGSTLGVSIVRRRRDLTRAFSRAFKFDSTCLLERYIPGKEIAVGILNGRALGTIEIQPVKGFYDFKTKYTSGLARHLYPAPLGGQVYRRAMRVAEEACTALGCEGAPRVDMRVTPQGRVYVLEVNALPGLTPLSLLPEIAQGEGIPFPDLVERILDGARLKAAVTAKRVHSQ